MQVPVKHSIKNWSSDDQPREKLLQFGPENLSAAELIAILINKGSRSRNAVELARDILSLSDNSLQGLGRLSLKDLTTIKGIGQAKAISIAAALELGRRRQTSDISVKPVFKTSTDAAQFLQPRLRDMQQEVMAVLFLNRRNKLSHYEVMSKGGITGTVVDPRIIMRKALEHAAIGLILCHNHPSGSLNPSRSDEELTQKIREAARFFDITLIDHIIVSREGFFSFADEGLL